MSNSLISIQHVSVSYDGRTNAIEEVNLEIYPQDFIGIIGPNGGGKTTLVKAILKAIPYSGEIIYAPEIENNGHRAIGYMPQVSDIDKSFPISVKEVVLSGLQAQKRFFGRALIADPKVLILDEPANFVDNKFEKELYTILRQLNNKMAIVMVSHDLGTITSYVKSIVCVNRHVHRHNSNIITPEQLHNYDCPIQLLSHGTVPHTILETHEQ